MSRKCLSIGVSTVEPVEDGAEEFPYLDGAVNAAETIGQWALHSGYAPGDVIVLTDKGGRRVTQNDLKQAFDTLLPEGSTTDHFFLSFAGHGLTGINDDTTYWLLSDSLLEGYYIFVEDLRRQLYAYGIHHLTIVSDACRAIAVTRDLRNMTPLPGVRRRHRAPLPEFEVARFNACQDTESAYMVRDHRSAAVGKCLFSGVLAEALWGRIPAAIDGAVIDSASLGRGLRAATRERAAQYNLALVPGGYPFFDKVIYFDSANPPRPPDPELPPWPAAASPAVSVTASVRRDIFDAVRTDATVRDRILGLDFGAAHRDIPSERSVLGLPAAAKPLVERVAANRRRLRTAELSPRKKASLQRETTGQVARLEALAADTARRSKASSLRDHLRRAQRRPQNEEADLVLYGPVRQIWSEMPIEFLGSTRSYSHFRVPGERREGQLLVEFDDGLFAPAWYYRNLTCVMLRDETGVTALSYQRDFGSDDEDASAAAAAIAGTVTGALSAAELDSLATKLRFGKHNNPVFGAIAAYCYDVTGDLDSIRRMAAYFGMSEQGAPYDLALMGMIPNDGRRASVPAVHKSRRAREGQPEWLTAATPAGSVGLAGRCPWLRQGWDFLSSLEESGDPRRDRLLAVRPHLRPAVFTTLEAAGGARLAKDWRLRPYPAG